MASGQWIKMRLCVEVGNFRGGLWDAWRMTETAYTFVLAETGSFAIKGSILPPCCPALSPHTIYPSTRASHTVYSWWVSFRKEVISVSVDQYETEEQSGPSRLSLVTRTRMMLLQGWLDTCRPSHLRQHDQGRLAAREIASVS